MPPFAFAVEDINNFWESFKAKLQSLSPVDVSGLPSPQKFLDLLSQIRIPVPFDGIVDFISNKLITADSIKCLEFLAENDQLSLLTISTGFNGEFEILHSVAIAPHNDENSKAYALSGLGSTANAVEILPERIFNWNVAAKVPNLVAFSKMMSNDTTGLSANDWDQNINVSNCVVLAPKFLAEIARNDCKTATEAFNCILALVRAENDEARAKWESSIMLDDGTEDIDEEGWTYAPVKEALGVLQTLWHFSTLQSLRAAGFRIASDTTASQLLLLKYAKLPRNPQQPHTTTNSGGGAGNSSSGPPPVTPPNTNDSLPPANPNRVQFNSNQSQNPNSDPFRDLRGNGNENNGNNNSNQNNNNDAPPSNPAQSNVTHPPTTTPTTDQMAQSMMITCLDKLGSSLETFANATAAQVKDKVSNNTRQMLALFFPVWTSTLRT